MRGIHVHILAFLLLVTGVGVCAFKVTQLGLPLTPKTNAEVWTVQARLQFEGRRKPAVVELPIPDATPGFVVLNEDYISSNYGLAVESEDGQRVASWAIRRARGPQTLYYRLQLARDSETSAALVENDPVVYASKPDYPEHLGSAVEALLQTVRQESADTETFTRQLIKQLNAKAADENIKLIREELKNQPTWADGVAYVLNGAKIPTRVLQGVPLGQARNDLELETWLQVHNQKKWLTFNPRTGERGMPRDFLIWRYGSAPLATIAGAKPPRVSFAVARSYQELVDIARKRAERSGSVLMHVSLFNLPVNTQNVYKIMLMVPLGALLMVFLRNVVGIRAFGTFMPILMALAFRETQLLWGLVLFTTLVTIGLLFRFYLERLMLLLVPRLAAVLTIVVILLAVVSVVSNEFGLQRGLSVALFPMVILAMTIERMSIVWEENGAKEAMIQGLGSLAVASIAYVIMSNVYLTHMMFVFPELLLVVLALTLWMGRYTGYRISELRRFKAAIKRSAA